MHKLVKNLHFKSNPSHWSSKKGKRIIFRFLTLKGFLPGLKKQS